MTSPATPSSRQRLSPAERRERLLGIGIELFGESSYDQLSTDEIAERAGISRGLLFHYFGNKRGYYVAVIRQAADQLLELSRDVEAQPPLAAEGDGPPAEGAERAQLDVFLRFVEDNAGLFTLLMQSGVGVDRQIKDIVDETRRVLAQRVAPGPSSPSTPLDRFALTAWIGAVEASAVEWAELKRREEHTIDRAQLAQLLIQMLPPVMRKESP